MASAAAADSIALREQAGSYEVLLRIEPGDPVIVTEAKVDVGGAALQIPVVREAVEAFRPKPGERNRNYNFAAGYRDEETDTSQSRTARLSTFETLDPWHGYTRTLGLQYLNGDFTIADEQRSSSLLFAEGTLARKRADDLLFPGRGLSLTYVLRLASEGMLSDTTLAQTQAHAKWVRPAGERSRAILRASLGAMAVDDFDTLPPELRFFAGGDRSIRGFDYQQIGETNSTGGVVA